jgi:hypothetical protein
VKNGSVVIVKPIETKEERKRRLAREATQRWREKHRDAHRSYQRQYREQSQFPECVICGREMGKKDAQRCIKCSRGVNHPAWKGGRWTNSGGYIMVLAREFESGRTKNGYILEHRRVMQDYLGRALRPEETVHHINGIRDDNRIDNLELWVSRQPPGQRVEQLVAWAKDLLETYGQECEEKW